MPVNIKRSKRDDDRLFDRFIDRTYTTDTGHKAVFSPTKGGSNTNWQNKTVIVGLELTLADGKTEAYDVSAGIIQDIKTSRSAPTATITISSLDKALTDLNAEKVKDGDQYHENRKLSFLLNTILVEVFKDNQNNLPDDKRVSSDLLTVKTIDDKLGYWSLDTYPGFDGLSFTPSPDAIPMTALTTNADRSIIWVATGGVNSNSTAEGLSATSQDRKPELWQYNIDEDKWILLATTDGTDNFAHAPIQNLWYNTYDETLYGTIWKDFGDTQTDIENKTHKLNWVCPPATVFKWKPGVNTRDSQYLNDATRSQDITNYWPGQWDFRMMYPFDHASKAGASRETDTQVNNETVKAGELETHKLSYSRASVGNFTAYRYTTVPFGPAGQQGHSNTHEARRGTHWMHPQVSGFDDTQRPANDIFGATAELVPGTATNGNSLWTGASTSGGTTAPTGWTRVGSTTFTLNSSTKVLTMGTGSDSDGVKFVLSSPVNNMSVYKLRITGTNFKIQVSNSSSASSTVDDSQVYGPIGMANTDGYTTTDFGNGDYYFSALETNAISGWHNADYLSVFITAENHSSDVVMTNVSLALAHHWDNWHNLSRQAAENIPLTHYSKVIGATSIRRPTHQFKLETAGPQSSGETRLWSSHAGPHQWFYNMFNDSVTAGTVTQTQIDSQYRDTTVDNESGRTTRINNEILSYTAGTGLVASSYTDIEDLQPPPYRNDDETNHPQSNTTNWGSPQLDWAGQRNEELVMEFNGIAQDRRNLSQIGSDGMHPMYGPNDLEDGLQPDTSTRQQVGSRNIDNNSSINMAVAATAETNKYGFTDNFYANEAFVADMGPHQSTGQQGFGSSTGGTAGIQRLNADDNSAQKSNQGFGYGSVVVQGLGERAAREEDTEEIYGAVRYTNGQQGCIVFNQEADSGKGVIVFQQFDGTAPADGSRFRWDPDATASQNGHFNLKWSSYKCEDKTVADITATNVAPITRSVSAVTPQSYTVVPIYGTAACSGEDGNIYIATHESRTHSALYTGSNEDDILNRSYIHRVDLGTGSFSTGSVTTTKIYDSASDASVYNTTMDGSSDSGRFANYAAGNAVNKTRKFLALHYSSDMSTNVNGTNGVFGTCFKRDSILAEYNDSSPYEPCHEVFVWAGTNNALKVLDHDIQSGTSYDAVGFTGFTNTKGKFGASDLTLGTNNGIVYFRIQKPTPSPGTLRDLVGVGVKVNYLYASSAGTFNAGNFIDDLAPSTTKKLHGNEGMIGHGQVVTGLIDKGNDNEREGLFTAFDDYRGWYQTSQKAKAKFAYGSIKHWFKIDDREVDPRVQLADYTGLKGFDAIAKLATANNMVFGFDVESFFLINRDSKSTTHTLNALDGDIIDIKKGIDNDIRNVISIQPFRPQVKDIEWEVTHVGGEEVLTDEQLFNGEFTITPRSHREASVNLICTRGGRLTKDSETDATANAVDSITNLGSRPLIPLFKWRTHSPTKQVVVMKDMASTDSSVFVNTLFASGKRVIKKGEIVIFTNPTTYEQIGRVITDVDTANNKLTLEATPAFEVLAGTPLNVVSAHAGSDITSDGSSNVKNYGIRYSDEGVTVITAVDDVNTSHGVCSSGNYSHYADKTTCEAAGHTWTPVTRLTVNNIRPFASARITSYSPESYKHYSFLVTTLSTSQLQTVTLPNQADSASATATTNAATSIYSSGPTGWVKAIDETNAYIYLNGTYDAFVVGDTLNAHYAMAPATLILQTEDGAIQPPPYTSLQQDLPEGLGTWSWKCDSESDKFNAKDIINLKFQGIKLEKDSGSIYTVADSTSIAKYGQRDWNFPDNRFIRHDKAEYWASKYLSEFGDPKYSIEATLPFDPTLTFTTPAGNALRKIKITDEVMFPGISEFSVSGYLREIATNVKALKTTVKFRTDEKY